MLDTHVLLWWLADDPALGAEVRAAVTDPDNLVAVSAASAWEMSIKQSLGKLTAPDDLEARLEEASFVTLAITVADALSAGRQPRHHDDPFDRMLVSRAQSGGWIAVTRDPRLSAYGIQTLPV